MKVQTWIPKKRPIARTLADVPSSREKPVLCWVNNGNELSPLWFDGIAVNWLNSKGEWTAFSRLLLPLHFGIYDQPPRPTKLEDVPDRWIVRFRLDGERIDNDTVHAFRESGKWLGLDGKVPYCMSDHWQLTDCIAELIEVEVEVMG